MISGKVNQSEYFVLNHYLTTKQQLKSDLRGSNTEKNFCVF